MDMVSGELRIDPKKCQILLSHHVHSPTKDREKKKELLFETFQVPAMYLAIDIVLAMFASGGSTGLVLDVGHGVTRSITIYEGYMNGINGEINGCGAVHRQNVGGIDLNEYMRQLLAERGHHFNSAADLVHVRRIKEKFCYLATDFESEIEDGKSISNVMQYELPDGEVTTVGNERFQCLEAPFNPKLMGTDAKLFITRFKKVTSTLEKISGTVLFSVGAQSAFLISMNGSNRTHYGGF